MISVIYELGWTIGMIVLFYTYYAAFAIGAGVGFVTSYFAILYLINNRGQNNYENADGINNHLNNNSGHKYNCICDCFKQQNQKLNCEMSGSAATLAKFDAAEMAARAKEWEAEVADEEKLAAQLDLDSASKLAAAKAAYDKHHKFVEEQLAQRMKVRKELAAKISANKAAESADAEYHAFVNSPEYCQFCQNLRDVQALDHEIDSLLLAEQRKGRPPVAADSCCDCCESCPEDCSPECACLACEGEATDGEEAAAAEEEAAELDASPEDAELDASSSNPLEDMGENPLAESQGAEKL